MHTLAVTAMLPLTFVVILAADTLLLFYCSCYNGMCSYSITRHSAIVIKMIVPAYYIASHPFLSFVGTIKNSYMQSLTDDVAITHNITLLLLLVHSHCFAVIAVVRAIPIICLLPASSIPPLVHLMNNSNDFLLYASCCLVVPNEIDVCKWC